ncbi:MAG: hypothetical protein KY464_00290 [Gemmatimonadetes bacterium]|nr:hypothetical protein [Gemmatimonadota bacterium]
MSNQYEVEVVFRQRAVYRIDAPDRQAAERIAAERWREGAPSVAPGYDWCELEAVRAVEAGGPEGKEQDAELVLRFLKERERLILKLGGDVFFRSVNDAISAAQVAADLGWSRAGVTSGTAAPDILRATEALELLCRQRRVVCFERPRVRVGERGEIRLYCTPEYLQSLSDSLETVEERQAV